MRRRPPLALAAAVLAAALTACGNGGSAPGTPPAPAPAPATPASPLPSAPTGLRVVGATSTSITWVWNPVESADRYAIQISDDGVFTGEMGIVHRTSNMFELTGLVFGDRMHVRVAAAVGDRDAQVLSAWTAPVMGISDWVGTIQSSTQVPIGFAEPRHAVVFEGSRVRAPLVVSGSLSDTPISDPPPPLLVPLESSAPAAQLRVPEEIEIPAFGRRFVELVAPADQRPEEAATYRVTLRAPDGGLPDDVWLDPAAVSFQVTVLDGAPGPDCGRLALDATGADLDVSGTYSTARLTLEGPQRVGLRLLDPYWRGRLEELANPPNLRMDLSDVPPITLAIPSALPYRELPGGGHRQEIALGWRDDLRLAAVAPGCEPAPLRCSEDTIRQQGCSR